MLFSLWMKSEHVTIQVEAAEQYLPVLTVVLFIMMIKVLLTFESVDHR